MPMSVSVLVPIPSSAVVMKSWTASISVVTRAIRSPRRDRPCSASDRTAEIVRDPLPDARRQVFFDETAERADDRDEHDRGQREVEDR
jgi:hypothetical protein